MEERIHLFSFNRCLPGKWELSQEIKLWFWLLQNSRAIGYISSNSWGQGLESQTLLMRIHNSCGHWIPSFPCLIGKCELAVKVYTNTIWWPSINSLRSRKELEAASCCLASLRCINETGIPLNLLMVGFSSLRL